jgi:hypothetical protein
MSTRPKSLTFIAVVAIVLGASTGLASVANGLAVKTSALMATAPGAQSGVDSPTSSAVLAAQAEFRRRVLEVNVRYHGLFMAIMPFALIAAGGLILGGAKALGLRRWSRPLLMTAMAVALVVEIACAKPQFEIQLEIADATATMMMSMVKATDAAPGSSHAAQSIVGATETMTRITATMGIAMRIVLSTAQVAFLIFGLIYLSRARTRELFAGQ